MSTMTSAQLAQLSPAYLAQDRSHSLLRLSIAFIVLQTFFFVLFIASRFTVKSSHGIETWLFMPAAYLCCTAQCISGILLVKIGGAGRHMAYWLLKDPQTLTTFLKLNTTEEIVYVISILLPKLAITAMYLRIFTEKWVRWATWLNGLVIVLNGLSGLILAFAICQPFEYNWNRTILGHCGDIMAAYRYISVPNIASDIALLILPISTLYKLHVSTLKKVGLFTTFLVGSLGVVTATTRTVYFFTTDLLSDPTWLCITTMPWTIVEPSAYFIFAVLPGLRPLLRHLFHDTRFSHYASSTASRILGQSRNGRDSALQKHRVAVPLSKSPASFESSTETPLRTSPADLEKGPELSYRLDVPNLQDSVSPLEADFQVYEGVPASPERITERADMENYGRL